MRAAFISILFFLSVALFAQQKDSTLFRMLGDSISVSQKDTAKSVDTSKSKKKYDVDAIVYAASADSLIFDVNNKKMYVYGSGELRYKETDLKSGKIFVDYNTNELEAFGIEDTSDTAKVKIKQTPVLKEGSEVYEGGRLRYNFKTQRGFISMAKNKAAGSRYEGEKVKKVEKDIYFIENGMFTTCENDTPHTYFTASEMKVIQRDKIIAKWIFMYIGGVPFPIPLPFAVFPNETGRRSGIIVPGYGQTADRGQYFNNFGYFFAISNYLDFALTGDYYTKGGYGLHGRLRYASRYNYSGSFNAGYSKIIIGEKNDPNRNVQTDWNFSLYHNQQLTPTSQFNVNLSFSSSNFYRNNSINYNDLLSQYITSNATFSKYWDESGNNLSVNYSRSQNLNNGDIYESLPNVTFTRSLSYPFKRKNAESLQDQKWYELISYSYSGQLRNERRKVGGNLSIRGGIQHDLSVSASPKIGYFSIAPSISYNEKWYNKRIKIENIIVKRINPVTNQVTQIDSQVVSDIKEINFVRTFNMSVSASTRFYGIFQPNIFGIEAFRHTVMPSISYNYKPDFASDTWGYYDSFTKSNGEVVRYDKYRNEIYGGVSSGESQSINFSVSNLFEIKTAKDPSDTTNRAESNKIQILNLNASLGYNFVADSLRLSDLYLSYRTQIGNLLNLSGSSSYTFYDFNDNFKINKTLVSAGKGLFRLTNFNFSISTTLAGKPGEEERKTQAEPNKDNIAFQKKDYISVNDDSETPDLSIPWNLSLNYNFNLSKPTPSRVDKFSNISADLSFSLTKNWKFTFRGSYDFDRKEVSAPQITVYRDLHCWQMNFIWNPIGYYRGFRFEIRLKSPELQDIKVTKTRGLYSGRR